MSTNNKDIFTFVIMPFSTDFDDTYKLGIKQAAEECNVLAERLDEQLFDEGMLDRVYRQIDISDFVIADLSDRNPNVFYELGYAHAKDKICILITKNAEDIPFDLKHKRQIIYGGSISKLKNELVKNIEWAKKESKARKETKISVTTHDPKGEIDLSTHKVDATITFTFDLHNTTSRISPTISAIYFYTGKQWTIRNDTKECPFSKSDIKPFKNRYLITPPTQKIGVGGWAQIKLIANRTLANTLKGDKLEDEYKVGGHSLLRIETDEGNYDHPFYFKLELDTIPF